MPTKCVLACNIKDTNDPDSCLEWDSLATIEHIRKTLAGSFDQVVVVRADQNLLTTLMKHRDADMVFNLAEGLSSWGSFRESAVPLLSQMLGIPCTGPDAACCLLTLDKRLAKMAVQSAGVSVPEPDGDILIVKPACEGSSIGIKGFNALWHNRDLASQAARLLGMPAMVEEFISGPELTVLLAGTTKTPNVLGLVQVAGLDGDGERLPDAQFVFGSDAKADWMNSTLYLSPPELSGAVLDAVQQAAVTAYTALGCRGIARLDFRIRGDSEPVFIEANPLPDLQPDPGGLLSLCAAQSGLGWDDVIDLLLSEAKTRSLT